MKTINLIATSEWNYNGFQERFLNISRKFYDYTVVVNFPSGEKEQENADYAILSGVTGLHDLIDRLLLEGKNIHLVLNTPTLIVHMDHPTGAPQESDYSVPIRVTSDTARSASYKVNAVTFVHEKE